MPQPDPQPGSPASFDDHRAMVEQLIAGAADQPQNPMRALVGPSTVSVFRRRAGEDLSGMAVSVRGNGSHGAVIGPDGVPGPARSEAELTAVMADVLTLATRR